jgi:hypothetical protein
MQADSLIHRPKTQQYLGGSSTTENPWGKTYNSLASLTWIVEKVVQAQTSFGKAQYTKRAIVAVRLVLH